MKRKKNEKVMLCFLMLTIIMVVFLNYTKVYALENEQIIEILINNKRFFVHNSMLGDNLRDIGWSVLCILTYLAASCQELYENTLGLLDFTTNETIETWLQEYSGVITAILALTIMILGIILIINHEKKPKLFISICLAGISITSISYILVLANEGIEAFAKEIVGDTMAVEIVNDSFYDLLYIDKTRGLASLDSNNPDYLKECHYTNEVDWLLIDVNEVINYNSASISEEAKQILGSQAKSDVNENGDIVYGLEAVYNGFGWNSGDDNDFLNNFYYRYNVDFLTIFLNLVAIIIVFLCMSYKVVRIIYEIIVHRFLAVLYSADLNGTQKTIKILTSLKDSYIVILLTAILVRLFKIFQGALSERFLPDNPFTYAILFLFVAFSVIDGPNIIQQLTGIDAGLSSGVGRMIATYHGIQGAKAAVGSAGRIGMWPLERARQNRMHKEVLNSNQQKNSNNLSGINENSDSIKGKMNSDSLGKQENKDKSSLNGGKKEQLNNSNQDNKNGDNIEGKASLNNPNNKGNEKDGIKKSNLKNEGSSINEKGDNKNEIVNKGALNGVGDDGSSSGAGDALNDHLELNGKNVSSNSKGENSLRNLKDNPLKKNELNSSGDGVKRMRKDLSKMRNLKGIDIMANKKMSSYNGDIYGKSNEVGKKNLDKMSVSKNQMDDSSSVSKNKPSSNPKTISKKSEPSKKDNINLKKSNMKRELPVGKEINVKNNKKNSKDTFKQIDKERKK